METQHYKCFSINIYTYCVTITSIYEVCMYSMCECFPPGQQEDQQEEAAAPFLWFLV